jgi:transcriptional regulator with XRE-family HTH domain
MAKTKNAGTGTEMEVGGRVRQLRQGRGLSLRTLATRAGVTAGALSLIENGRSSPSVSTLKKILTPLNLTLGAFFAADRPLESGFVVRRNRLVNVASGKGLRYLALPGLNKERALQIMHETYAPGADTGGEPYSHAGEEAGFCVAGTIAITVAGRTEILRPGDAYYFPSTLPHRWRNTGRTPARLISSCTPPSF